MLGVLLMKRTLSYLYFVELNQRFNESKIMVIFIFRELPVSPAAQKLTTHHVKRTIHYF